MIHRSSYPDHQSRQEEGGDVAMATDDDEEIEEDLNIQQDGYELVLPSGKERHCVISRVMCAFEA